jgi:hypothetical protein
VATNATNSQLFLFFATQVLNLSIPGYTPGIGSPNPIPMFIPGWPHPDLSKYDDWLEYFILSGDRHPSRLQDDKRDFSLQIIVYSIHGGSRKNDRKLNNELAISDAILPTFDQQRFLVSGSDVQLKEAKVIPLDLRSMGDFAEKVKQRAPDLNVNTAVILVDGCIIQQGR